MRLGVWAPRRSRFPPEANTAVPAHAKNSEFPLPQISGNAHALTAAITTTPQQPITQRQHRYVRYNRTSQYFPPARAHEWRRPESPEPRPDTHLRNPRRCNVLIPQCSQDGQRQAERPFGSAQAPKPPPRATVGRFEQEEEAVRDSLQVVALRSTYTPDSPARQEEDAIRTVWVATGHDAIQQAEWGIAIEQRLTGGDRAPLTPRASFWRRSVLRPSSPTPPSGSVCVSSSSRTARRSPLSVSLIPELVLRQASRSRQAMHTDNFL